MTLRFRLFLLGALLIGHAAGASAATLTLTPSASPITVGSPVSVDLFISGLTAGLAPSLGSYDIKIGFDDTLLSFGSASYGTGLNLGTPADSFAVTDSSVAGVVWLSEVSLVPTVTLDSSQPGSFLVATLNFLGIAPGVSPLSFVLAALYDTDAVPLATSTVSSSVTIEAAPVPEASPWLAALLGLVGVMLLKFPLARRNMA